MQEYTIDGHDGVWELKDSYLTELGFLMIKFYNRDRGVFMNLNTEVNLKDLLVKVRATKISEETTSPDITTIY
jgi:hypothetical protein